MFIVKYINYDLKELRRRLQFMERILENSCDEVYVTDGHGITIYANPISENHYGVPVEELIGKSVWELEKQGVYYPAVTPIVLREKKSVTIDQETATGKNLRITATPIFDSKGNIEMVICNSRDVTALADMKRNYDEIKKKVLHQNQKNSKSSNTEPEPPIFASGSPMENVNHTIVKIATTSSTVLLLGDSGTGKDLYARYVHKLSPRLDKQFLKVNCAAIPKELLESELFGYKAGAFTGASPKGKLGLFSLANRGTIFLDEIGELPLRLQPKLLQVIEEQEFTPIGSDKPEKVDVRIIASTNQDLSQMIAEGQFREDLYYRLCVLSVKIPPLRERLEDIPLLTEHFLNEFAYKHNRRILISRAALQALRSYHWPGNVRELKHLLEYLTVVFEGESIKPEDLPLHVVEKNKQKSGTLSDILECVEEEIIMKSFRELGSSYKVARKLGISQSTAFRKINKYKLLQK